MPAQVTEVSCVQHHRRPTGSEPKRHGCPIVIANVGDQPSDLDRGFAQRIFLLPNPFCRVP